MDLGLKDKVALVAGASQGLGKAVALGLAREGAHVAILSRDRARIQAAAKEIRDATGAPVLGIVADVSRGEEIDRAVSETATRFGTIHIAITNAGGPPPMPFVEIGDDLWHQYVDQTLMSAVRLSRAAVPFMQKQKWGRIIHMTSHTIKHPIENLMLSNSIRAAVVGLAKTQSFELAPHGILVNSVGPGATETARIQHLFADRAKRNQTTFEHEYAAAAKNIPVGRIGQPEEFANVVVFLASERASFVNGVYVQIDGGEQRTPF